MSEIPLDQLRESVERKALETQLRLIENVDMESRWVNPSEPLFDGGGNWQPLGSLGPTIGIHQEYRGRGECLPWYTNEAQLWGVQSRSRNFCETNAYAINAIENRQAFIVGTGLEYTVEPRPGMAVGPELLAAVQSYVDEFRDANDFCELETEIVKRCDTYGEAFIRIFANGPDVPILRLVESNQVRSPSGAGDVPCQSFGVETEPEDLGKIIGYWVGYNFDNLSSVSLIPAEEIVHFKLNTNRNVKRGLPTFVSVDWVLEGALKVLRNTNRMAQIQASVAMIRRRDGVPPAQVNNWQEMAASWKKQSAPPETKAKNVQRFEPGTILDADMNTQYEFPGGTVNAASFVQIQGAGVRVGAARLNMPEYMLSADASNANYSSTQVAESPSMKTFERLQRWYGGRFGMGVGGPRGTLGIIGRAILLAEESGRIPRDTSRSIELKITYPSTVVRNKTEETNRRQILSINRVLSPQTWAAEEGLDYEIEQANIEEHQEAHGSTSPFLPDPTQPNQP